MKISAILLCAVMIPVCWGQETPFVTKIVRVRGDVINIVNAACPGSGIDCRQSAAIRAIVLRGKPAAVADVEKTIRELDGMGSAVSANAAKNVEITVYVIAGSAEPIPGTQDVSGEALSPVVKQLRPIFPYAHYQLLGTMLLRSAQGAAGAATGVMKSVLTQRDVPSDYRIMYDRATLSPDAPTAIELKKFDFSVSVPVPVIMFPSDAKAFPTTQYQRSKVGIQADIDLREGQKVVVGKANVGDSDTCFFIVLSARLVP